MFIFALILLLLGAAGIVVWRLQSRKVKARNTARKARYETALTEYRETKDRYASSPNQPNYDSLWGARVPGIIGGALAVLGILFFIPTLFFTQDVGQANVVKDWTGNVITQTVESGLHGKAPWQDTVTFDIRNQRVVYVNPNGQNSQGDNSGGQSDGPQVTVQDKDGVTDQVDITVRYSISPDSVIGIYTNFLNEEGLKAKLLSTDIRAVTRAVSGQYTNLDLLTKRGEVALEIQDQLATKWKDEGITVEEVSIQEIVPPQNVQDSYAAAQQAEIDVAKAQSELDSATVAAQKTVAQAQAQADANAILNSQPLNDKSLQQKYIEAIANGKAVFVVPEGSAPLIQVPAQ